MRLPDGLGLELVEEVSKSGKNTPIAVITAFGSTDNAVIALKAGAFDYVSKPVALDQLRKLVNSALQVNQIKNVSNQSAAATSRLLGQSQAMQELRQQIGRLARSMAPVSICGESGSGKELAAREIHALSARAGKPFVAVNCGAIPEALMEAEFFGYRKGAFTGAAEEREGFFQAANGGTLMLDEVADLPLAMQVKLLRAIQERAVRKIGATAEEAVDVRIISATHQNLEECVANKRFRQDLYYRLNVIELKLPALRERLDDVEMLSAGILQRLSGKAVALSPDALSALRSYDFPGNVRELENILERALAFASEGIVELVDLALKPTKLPLNFVVKAHQFIVDEAIHPVFSENTADNVLANAPVIHPADGAAASAFVAVSESMPLSATTRLEQSLPIAANPNVDAGGELPKSLPAYLEQIERDIILRALQKTRYNKTQAAELLGVSFRQLRYQIQKLKIDEAE
jgi:two-component system response regulator PilR (NtrC family)